MLKDNVNTSSVFADRLKSSADVVTVTSRSVRSSFASRVSNKKQRNNLFTYFSLVIWDSVT